MQVRSFELRVYFGCSPLLPVFTSGLELFGFFLGVRVNYLLPPSFVLEARSVSTFVLLVEIIALSVAT